MTTERLTIALAMREDGEPPSEFRIFPAGKWDTTKGPFVFDEASALSVVEHRQDYGNDVMIDYDHRSITHEGPPENSKAAGWASVEVRDGELWAVDVRWTEAAKAGIRAKEWRYVSPYFELEPKARRVTKILNVAITNMPATKKQEPLVAANVAVTAKEQSMSNTILVALGLSEAASEADAVAKIMSNKKAVESLVALSGSPSFEEALGVFHAWKKAAEQVETLSAEVTSLKADKARLGIEKRVDALIDSGHLTPAERAEMVALGVEHPASFDVLEKRVQKMPPVVAASRAPSPTGNSAPVIDAEIVVDDEIRAELSRQGLSEDEYRKTQKHIIDRDRAAGRLGR